MNLIIQEIEKIQAVFLLLSMSVALRFLLQIVGQRWITTTAHTATLVLLPILTYTITSVISGNIALSLGMVGALSIVRFRNPVRSPLELSVYFGAITMGIAASVDQKWVLFLFGAVCLSVLILLLIHFLLKIFGHSFFSASFSEGNSLSTLEVKSSKPLSILENNKFLTLMQRDSTSINYVLTSNNFLALMDLVKDLDNDKNVLSSQIRK
jgi:hypothetical protein